MGLRAVLLTSVLATGCLTIACGGMTDRVTAPTSERSAGTQGSSQAAATCDAAEAQWAIGQRASDDLLERARVAAHAGSARFIRPGQPITMEYLASRLNIDLNEHDVVRAASCG